VANAEPAFSTGTALQVRSPPTAPRRSSAQSPADNRVAILNPSAFESLDKNHVGADQLPYGITVKTMNRYKNILPNPHSRVNLQQIGDDPTTSYINANYITSIDGGQRDYIAAQGPKPDCVLPFWRMLWQEDVKVIIMVTGLIERGKSKCSRYWPDRVHRGNGTEGVIKYGNVIVKVVSAKQRAGYKVAELQATVGSETRTVMHFWFDSWPDFGVPSSSSAVTDMLQVANKYDPAHKNPWLIHCSARIGRTGTFIGIDLGMKMVEKLNAVDTIMLIEKMRNDRGGMVQTRDQYEFLHTVLSDFFALTGKEVAENLYGNVAETGGKGATPEAVYNNMSNLPFSKVEKLYEHVTIDKRSTVMYSENLNVLKLENDYETVGGMDDVDGATDPSNFDEPDVYDETKLDVDEDEGATNI
jgi:protein tyrosine phosphatase